jgi:O-antigen ligase
MPTQNPIVEKETKYFYLFLAFIFLLPLWPNYAELKFGGLPNLAPDRLLRIALFFGFVIIFFTNSAPVQLMKQRLEKHWVLVFALTAFYGMRILSAFLSPNTVFQLYVFLKNEFLVSFPVFFYALLAIRDTKSIKKILITLVVSGFIASIVALIDFYKKKNLFMDLVPVNTDYLMSVFLDKTRDDSYRAQGTFEHPIMLGQFFIFLIPIVWITFRQSKNIIYSLFYLLTGFLSLATIYISGSRAALGLGLIVILIITLYEIYEWSKISKHRILQYLILSQIPIPIFALIIASYTYKQSLIGGTQETLSSTNSRLDMLIGGIPKIFESPVYGHGLGEAISVFSLVGRAGIQTLDNYYILLGLETGIICLLLFFIIFSVTFIQMAKFGITEKSKESSLAFSFALILFIYTIQMAIHSLHQQIWLVYLLMACYIVLQQNLHFKKVSK